VVGRGGRCGGAARWIEAYERALEPKALVVLPGGHFDAYTTGFEGAAGAATDCFVAHLLEG